MVVDPDVLAVRCVSDARSMLDMSVNVEYWLPPPLPDVSKSYALT